MGMTICYPQVDMQKATITIHPISIEPRAEYPDDMNEVYNFEEGDELFIYSDGLVDTVNERKEDFGKDRLLNLIYRVCDMPAKMQMVEVEKQIAMFQGRAPQKDDLTFIILKK